MSLVLVVYKYGTFIAWFLSSLKPKFSRNPTAYFLGKRKKKTFQPSARYTYQIIHFSGRLRLFKFIAFQTTDKVCTLWRKWILLRVKWTASHFKCIINSPQALSYWFFLYYFILKSGTLHNCGPCWQSAWQQ